MASLFRLRNSLKRYAWGSTTEIPRLLSLKNAEGPYAELWMGAHPNDPSYVQLNNQDSPLYDLIDSNPAGYLGKDTAQRFGGLPFLFKVLAAAKPLSIQAHPNAEQAREGWQRENDQGIAIDDPKRNYRDPNHKPEILCAMSPFKAMCGFRQPEEILALFDRFDAPILHSLKLRIRDAASPLRELIRGLFALSISERALLEAYAIRRARILVREDSQHANIWQIVETLSSLYPGDPGIVAPLYLNCLNLQPGQAIYLPAGIFHAYIEGIGIELMANSDNVLRGGLTTKPIDPEELSRILYFEPYNPQILTPSGRDSGISEYPTHCAEFTLFVVAPTDRITNQALPADQPLIILVIEGDFTVKEAGGASLNLGRGDSIFIAANSRKPDLSGHGLAYIASTGLSHLEDNRANLGGC